jgi:hypothetical protein
LTLAHQYLEQVPERLRQSVFGNSGSFISFRVGAEDAPLVAKTGAATFLQRLFIGWNRSSVVKLVPFSEERRNV